jgi:hypothetical protein
MTPPNQSPELKESQPRCQENAGMPGTDPFSLRRTNFYVARAVLAMMAILIGAQGLSNIAAQVYNDDPYEVVMRLYDDYRKAGNAVDLISLAGLVRSERFGPNAAGALALLARYVKRNEAETVVIPALVEGLGATNIAIRRGAAMALSDYSRYAAPVVPDLVKFLNSNDEFDKVNADSFVIETLGRVGREASRAVPTLLKIVDWPEKEFARMLLGSSSPRAAAVVAIDQIGFSDSTTRLRLEKALDDSSPDVRCASARALIDNGFVSEAALATLSRTIVTKEIRFTLKPATLRLIGDAATNANPSIQEAARILLKKLKNE